MYVLESLFSVLLWSYFVTSLIYQEWLDVLSVVLICALLFFVVLIEIYVFRAFFQAILLLYNSINKILINPTLYLCKEFYNRLRLVLNKTEKRKFFGRQTDTAKTQEVHNQTNSYRSDFNPYSVLEVSQNASLAEIKSSYRKQLMLYHPDRVSHLGEELQKLATKKTQEIKRAFESLALN